MADDRWVAQRQAMARMVQQAPPPRSPVPMGGPVRGQPAPPQRGVVGRPSWQDIIGGQKAKPAAQGHKGLVGRVLSNPVVHGGLQALSVLDVPRRGVTALVAPTVNMVTGHGPAPEQQKNIWEAIKDPTYGSQQALGIDNRLLGFAADTALDPLTYVSLGSGRFAGGTGRLAAAEIAAERGLSEKVVAQLAREGVSTADDATRAALGLEGRGMHFAGLRVPGTETIGKGLGRATTNARLAVMDTKAGNAIRRGFAGAEDGLAETRAGLFAGTSANPTHDVAMLAASDAKRAARGTLSARLQHDAVRVIKEPDVQAARSKMADLLEGSIPAANAEERAAVRKFRAFFDRGKAEANARGAQIADRYNYVPHVVSDAAHEAWTTGDQRLTPLFDNVGKMASIENPRSRQVVEQILGEQPKSWSIAGVNEVSQRNLGYKLLEDDIGRLTEKWVQGAGEAVGDSAQIQRLRDFGVAKDVGQVPAQHPNAVANLQAVLAQQEQGVQGAAQAAAASRQAAEQGVQQVESGAQGLAAGLEREVQDARNAMPGLRGETLAAQRGVGEAETAAQRARADALRLIPNEALQGDLTQKADDLALRAAEARTSQADLQGLAQVTAQEAQGGRATLAYENFQRERAAARLSAADRTELTAIENGRGVRSQGDLARERNVRAKSRVGEVAVGDAKTPVSETSARKAGVKVRQQSGRDSLSAGRSAMKADESLWGGVENMPPQMRQAHDALAGSTKKLEDAQRVLQRSQRNTKFAEDLGRTTTRSRGAKVLEVLPEDLPKFNEHVSNQLATYLQFTEDWQDAVARLPEGASKEAMHQAEVHAHALRKRAARLLGMSEASSFGDVSDAAEEALRAGAFADAGRTGTTVLGGDPVAPLSRSVDNAVAAERDHLVALQKYQIQSEYHARVRAAEEWASNAGVQLGPDAHLRIAKKVVSEQSKTLQDAVRSQQKSLADFLDKSGKALTSGGKPKFDPEVVDLVRGLGAVSAEPYAELRNTLNDTVREYDRIRKAAMRKTLTDAERADLSAQREAVRQKLVDLSGQASQMLKGVGSGAPRATVPSTIGKAWASKLTQAETLLREQSYRLAPVRNQVTEILRDGMATNKGIQNQLSQVQARLSLVEGADFGADHIAQLLDDHLSPELLMTNPKIAAARQDALAKSIARQEKFQERLPAIVDHFQKLDEKVAEAFSPGGGWAKLDVPPEDLQAVRQILADPEYTSAKKTLADMEREIDALRYQKVTKEVGSYVEKPGGGTEFVPTGTQEITQQEIPAVSKYAARAGLGKEGAPRPRTWEQAKRFAEGALEIRSRYDAPALIAKVQEKDRLLNEFLDQWAEELPMRARAVEQMKRERAATLGQWTQHLRVIDEEAKKADSIVLSAGASDHAGAFEKLAAAIDEAKGRAPKERVGPKPTPNTITADELQAAQTRAMGAESSLSDAAKTAEQLQRKADRARSEVNAMQMRAQKERTSWAKGVKDADGLAAKARANYDSAATLELDAQDWMQNVAPRLESMWEDQVKNIIAKPADPNTPIMERLRWAQETAKTSDLIRTAQGNPTHENIAIAKLAADLQTAELDHAGAQYATNVTKDMIAQAKRGKLYTQMVDQVEEGWVQLERSGLQVPKEVETALKNLRKPGVDSKFWDTVGQYNLMFKALATTTPGFHIRNALSATFMNVVDGVEFRTMKQAIGHYRAYAANPNTWTKGMGAAEGAMAERAMEAAYATGAGQFTDELRGLQELPGLKGKVANNAITRKSRDAGHAVETSARYAMALDTLKKGGTFDEAVSRIRRFHFDYENIGQYDQAIKKVIPFWMFASRNVPMQVQTMWLKPRWYSIYDNFRRNMALGNDPVIPSYIEQEGGFKVGGGTYLSPDLPQMRLFETFNKLEDPKRALADASPIFRVPAELAAGKQFYNDIPFRPDDQRTPVQGWENILKPLYAATGQLNSEGVTDKGQYAVKSLIPTIGQAQRLAPTQDRYKERQLASMASYLGIPLRQVGPEAIAAEQRRRARSG